MLSPAPGPARSLAPCGCYHVLGAHVFDSTTGWAVVNRILSCLWKDSLEAVAVGVPVIEVGAPSTGYSDLLHSQSGSGSGGQGGPKVGKKLSADSRSPILPLLHFLYLKAFSLRPSG